MYLKKKKGMTIVELLIASLILSIIFMGFTALQIRTILNTEYANRNNMASFLSADLISLIQQDSYLKKDRTQQEILFKKYEDSFNKKNYPQSIENCRSDRNLENIDYCSKDLMIDYNVKNFKEDLSENIPKVQTKFQKCNNSNNYCLIITWNKTPATEQDCKLATGSCLLREVVL